MTRRSHHGNVARAKIADLVSGLSEDPSADAAIAAEAIADLERSLFEMIDETNAAKPVLASADQIPGLRMVITNLCRINEYPPAIEAQLIRRLRKNLSNPLGVLEDILIQYVEGPQGNDRLTEARS